jgi:hypothetical protein
MLEYVAYALLGLVMIGCLLYVTMSLEMEDSPNPERPDQPPATSTDQRNAPSAHFTNTAPQATLCLVQWRGQPYRHLI